MIIPQPVIRRIPGLTTNEDIRTMLVLQQVTGRLLDIGCGSNRLVQAYRQQGGEGLGVDIYPWEGVDLLVADSSHLPYPAESFDTIILVASLNHIPNREEVLEEVHRLLTPAGRLLVTSLTPRLSRLWHAWAFWDKDQHERGMKPGETWGFTHAELLEMFRRNHFRVISRQWFSWGLNNLYVCAKIKTS